MVIRSQLLSLSAISGKSQKTGKDYSFHSLALVDLDATEADLIKVNVNDSHVDAVKPLIGKTVSVGVNFARGGFSFIGVVK